VHAPGHSQARRPGEAGGDLDMALPDIPGLDLQMAMHHVDGDPALLRATLAAFTEHAVRMLDSLPQAIAAGNWAAVAREAHTLKGLGGTIGATALQGYARGLEAAALAQDTDGVQRESVLLIQVMTSLVKYLQNQTSKDSTAPAVLKAVRDGTAQERTTAQRLKQLTGECDSEALALWQQHRSDFAAWLPAVVVDRLHAALGRCDFDAAFGLLEELDLEADLNAR